VSHIKRKLHPRNRHRGRYDFEQLTKHYSVLEKFVFQNKYGDKSIDFSDPKAVLALNTALLKVFYDIEYWQIPDSYLCPPIPGRADYIHHIADLLNFSNETNNQNQIMCLDIGVGANCIYPIIGVKEYGWTFVGTDIDKRALASAELILNKNTLLKGRVELRFQNNSKKIFEGIINKNDYFDVVICNPPFHSSKEEALKGASRKIRNLTGKHAENPVLNFGGVSGELWCVGGEKRFVENMIYESRDYKGKVRWFTSLISKKAILPKVYNMLKKVKAKEVKTIPMGQGNKISRIVAWRY